MPGFDALDLPDAALDAVHRLGWREPTPVQAEALPPLLAGHDVLAEAETGSGKTGAFGLALVARVRGPGLGALVLAPTRELAQQIAEDLNALGAGSAFRAVAVHGGVPWDPQLAALRDPTTTCIVATPGRLLEFLRDRKVTLDRVRFAVVDEADRMLDLGFLRDVERILADLPRGRQLSMFSATIPPAVETLARRHLPLARRVQPATHLVLPDSSEHVRVDVASSQKREALLALLAVEAPRRALLFARTRGDVKDLALWLTARGVPAEALHGDLAQSDREAVLERFRRGEVPLLVATDVAARGLDVEGVTHVLNYAVPEEPDAYVHRAGRTARAGRPGRVVSLLDEKDQAAFARAIRGVGVRPERMKLSGFEAPAAAREDAGPPPGGPPRRKADKKRQKPGWEQRKGRR